MAAALLALSGGAGPAQAQAASLYVATDIPVDASADNAVQARERAVAQGIQAGLREVMSRITAPADHGRLPTPSAREAESMVLGLSFAEERTSAVRYLAKLTVRFVPQAVRGALDRAGIPYTDTQARTVVILPVWKAGGAESLPVLWEDPNPWRAAWANRPRGGGLVPVEVPLGDLQDVTAIDALRAEALDQGALAAIAARYAAGEALVAVATLRNPGQLGPVVDVRAVHSVNPGAPQTLSIAGSPSEPLDAVLERAAAQLAGSLEGEWKAATLTFSGGVGTIEAQVPAAGLEDWLAVLRRLESSAAVRKVAVSAMSRGTVLASITHGGTPEQFAAALAERGLALARDPAGSWTLTPQALPVPVQAPTPDLTPQPAPVLVPPLVPPPGAEPADEATPTADALPPSGDPRALPPSGDPRALPPSGDPRALPPSGDPRALPVPPPSPLPAESTPGPLPSVVQPMPDTTAPR